MKYQDKVYGEVNIDEGVILDIINSKALQRLKGINQYGTWVLVDPKYDTSRFEHSVGVMIVLEKLGADLKEQLAGLVHDVSHTAFSHVVDYVFGKAEVQDYHEEHAKEFISKTDLPEILKKYGYDWQEIIDEERFLLLEKKQPAVCADRVDYILRDGQMYGLFGKEFISQVLDSLKVKGTDIYYDNVEVAKESANMYFKMGDFWASPMQSLLFQLLSQAMRIGLDEGTILESDLWGTDDELLGKLKSANHQEINRLLALIKSDLKFEIVEKDWDYHIFTKVRYSDPLVMVDNELKVLSEVDAEFKKKAEDFKKERKEGYKIKILENN